MSLVNPRDPSSNHSKTESFTPEKIQTFAQRKEQVRSWQGKLRQTCKMGLVSLMQFVQCSGGLKYLSQHK